MSERYEKMLNKNIEQSKIKEQLAVEAIKQLVAQGNQVSIKTLVERTGLSRSFFYQNENVVAELKKHRKTQRVKSIAHSQKVVLDKALEKDNDLLNYTIKELKEEIRKLKKENEALKRQLLENT